MGFRLEHNLSKPLSAQGQMRLARGVVGIIRQGLPVGFGEGFGLIRRGVFADIGAEDFNDLHVIARAVLTDPFQRKDRADADL